jgi:hypothetical protein
MVNLRIMDMVYFFESENAGYMLNIKDDLKFRIDRNDNVVIGKGLIEGCCGSLFLLS